MEKGEQMEGVDDRGKVVIVWLNGKLDEWTRRRKRVAAVVLVKPVGRNSEEETSVAAGVARENWSSI